MVPHNATDGTPAFDGGPARGRLAPCLSHRQIPPPPRMRFAIRRAHAVRDRQRSLARVPTAFAFRRAGLRRLLERYGCAVDFVVAPDVVGDAAVNLILSRERLPRLRHLHLVLAVQDGMWHKVLTFDRLLLFRAGVDPRQRFDQRQVLGCSGWTRMVARADGPLFRSGGQSVGSS